jgi:hypothetical protein
MGYKLSQLEWEVYKHSFDVQLGEASICTITDVRLCSTSRTDIHAVAEVKPFNADVNGHRDVGLDQRLREVEGHFKSPLACLAGKELYNLLSPIFEGSN